ncbi:MAG: homospermidine biosynthesis protein [Planctomycetota bacterium]|jgi:deoxyhypusine synthase
MERHPCGGERAGEYLGGRRILPKGLTGAEPVEDVVENAFMAYNAARLREGAALFATRMLEPEVTVGMTLAGALTPAGVGASCVVPLIEAGFVDWIVSTGANLYHDLHFVFDCPLHAGSFSVDDNDLHEAGVVRIYDVLLSKKDCLLATDYALIREIMKPEYGKRMGSAELHHLLGGAAAKAEEAAGGRHVSLLAAAHRAGVPVYTSSPGDSSIGMEIAALAWRGHGLELSPNTDVNETAGIVYGATKDGGKSAIVMVGGGSPKNFALQTEPHVQDICKVHEERGHDYFLQMTDARPDTGGLSGATPREAVSWGKVDPEMVPSAVVCYCDSTIALPLITHYALAKREPRELKRLYDRREALARELGDEYLKRNADAVGDPGGK